MRKNISWTKKIALAVAAGAIMVAGSVSAMAATCTHVWDTDNVVITKPTCTVDGTLTYTCKLCQETKTVFKSAKTGHNMSKYVTINKDFDGDNVYDVIVKYAYCQNDGCKYLDVQSVKSLKESDDHAYRDVLVGTTDTIDAQEESGDIIMYFNLKEVWSAEDCSAIEIEETCDQVGMNVKICKVCGAVESTVTDATGHDYKVTKSTNVTNSAAGTATVICKNEEDEPKATVIVASLNCQNGEHEEDKKTGICKNCGVSLTATAPTEPTTPADEEPSEEPAETKVSSGTVVGGGIAAAGILTLITLIVKYLGSVLF